jgi:hypothetical protein
MYWRLSPPARVHESRAHISCWSATGRRNMFSTLYEAIHTRRPPVTKHAGHGLALATTTSSSPQRESERAPRRAVATTVAAAGSVGQVS